MSSESFWAVSNASKDIVRIWLEPWADEVELAPRSSALLQIFNDNADQDAITVELTDEHVVVWANGGDRIKVLVDQILQETGSATIPVPDVFGGSAKPFLQVVFGGRPEARLAGAFQPSRWQRFKARLAALLR